MQKDGEVEEKSVATASVYSRLVRADISHGAFRLWHLLNDYRNKESGLAWPKQETIAEQMHCKIDSLKGWTAELVQSGFLKAEKKGQKHYFVYSFPVAFPQWVERDDSGIPQKGETRNGESPIGGGPRTPPMGGQTEKKELILSISNSRLLRKRIPATLEYKKDGHIREKATRMILCAQ